MGRRDGGAGVGTDCGNALARCHGVREALGQVTFTVGGFGTWHGKLSVGIVFATIVEYSCSAYLSTHVAVYQCSIVSMKHAKLLSGQLGCAVAVIQHEIQLSNLGDMQTRRGDDM
jgi:hypothetical protein